ncbi:hypothetical protein SLA2020_087400 [Shorea laevis]
MVNINQLRELIQDIKPALHKEDIWSWEWEKAGGYTVRSSYSLLTQHLQEDNHAVWKKCWNKLVPSKVCAFMWQALHKRIPTKDNLLLRGVLKEGSQTICNLCGSYVEDVDHLLLSCSVVWRLWTKCFTWWGLTYAMHQHLDKAFQQHVWINRRKKCSRVWEATWFAVIWTIWLCRNENIFKETNADEEKLFTLVQIRSFHWIFAKSGQEAFNFTNWISRPGECLNLI